MEKQKSYLKDKRSPLALNENVSKIMSKNKAKNTRPELLLRKMLWNNGLKGYRIHPKTIPGKPDICYLSKKIAIFVNGCFWHRCPHCSLTLPKNNTEFWKEKFEKNIKRDKEKNKILENDGWQIVTVWECELKNKLETTFKNIELLISN
ncbi:very short patch repair endonuclease [Chryseobacterium fluminis]|uniref:very short patch repair endonuclease n=1 Tax=Chryseobacterium fluminis TaxID=2983606 RepID=UPI002255C6AF|nr:very short patch repair endonuclease [Chryseobacterium sp. MMS21-Ot14]UZT97065.1 very short patch repair endonuclease [Chryseobacterium sp. MMS21-Ot14]